MVTFATTDVALSSRLFRSGPPSLLLRSSIGKSEEWPKKNELAPVGTPFMAIFETTRRICLQIFIITIAIITNFYVYWKQEPCNCWSDSDATSRWYRHKCKVNCYSVSSSARILGTTKNPDCVSGAPARISSDEGRSVAGTSSRKLNENSSITDNSGGTPNTTIISMAEENPFYYHTPHYRTFRVNFLAVFHPSDNLAKIFTKSFRILRSNWQSS